MAENINTVIRSHFLQRHSTHTHTHIYIYIYIYIYINIYINKYIYIYIPALRNCAVCKQEIYIAILVQYKTLHNVQNFCENK